MDPVGMPLTPLAFIVSGAGAGLLLALAVRIAPWRRLRSNDLTHVFLGSTFALILLWSIRASVDAGFAFHLLGTAGLALVVGPALALVGGAIVVIVTSLIQAIPLSTVPVAFLLEVALPVMIVTLVLRIVESRLPANLFVYLFVAGFFGAGLAMAAAAFAALGSLAAVARIARESAFAEFAPYIVYLAFGEATLTGMLLTLGVIYRPRWIATYDIDRYLPRPTR
jgi:uncharacterized membrane protein